MFALQLEFNPNCPGGDACCTPENKCREHEGHCASDEDCKEDLICGTKNCKKRRGLQFSNWNTNLNWIDNCCERKGINLLNKLAVTKINRQSSNAMHQIKFDN